VGCASLLLIFAQIIMISIISVVKISFNKEMNDHSTLDPESTSTATLEEMSSVALSMLRQ
jgi:hypothetical protein